MRRTRRALTSAPRPFLPEGLGPAPRHLSPGLGALCTPAGRGQLRGYYLVHQRHVGLHTEHLVIEVMASRHRSVDAAYIDVGHHPPPFTASRMTTSPPRGPGTAPLMSTNSRSAS